MKTDRKIEVTPSYNDVSLEGLPQYFVLSFSKYYPEIEVFNDADEAYELAKDCPECVVVLGRAVFGHSTCRAEHIEGEGWFVDESE